MSQPLTDVLAAALQSESQHHITMMEHLKNESAHRGDMITCLQNDLQFRKDQAIIVNEQARQSNKTDQLLSVSQPLLLKFHLQMRRNMLAWNSPLSLIHI